MKALHNIKNDKNYKTHPYWGGGGIIYISWNVEQTDFNKRSLIEFGSVYSKLLPSENRYLQGYSFKTQLKFFQVRCCGYTSVKINLLVQLNRVIIGQWANGPQSYGPNEDSSPPPPHQKKNEIISLSVWASSCEKINFQKFLSAKMCILAHMNFEKSSFIEPLFRNLMVDAQWDLPNKTNLLQSLPLLL